MNRLFDFFTRKKPKEVIVVSGLPRSGTSLMMKMLEAGGIAPLTDNHRTADEDNPKGYYELERVKRLADGNSKWLGDARGKAVKIISALLPHLPVSHTFRIIFMERAIDEILISQNKMLNRRDEDPDKVSDKELASLFATHLQQTNDWLQNHRDHVNCLHVNYNYLLKNNRSIIASINDFLGGELNTDAMNKVIDPSLYRSKGQLSEPS